MLDQLHSAIFQVNQTDSHPPQQLQVFRVVCHEVLGPQRRTAHTGLTKRRGRKKKSKKLKNGRDTLQAHELVEPVCIHTDKELDGGSSCPQHYGLVLSGYGGRRGQETGGEC